MRKLIVLFLLFCSVFVYANPGEYIQESISWIGKGESDLIAIGAVKRGDDVDLRQYGMKLLRYYVWAKGNIGFWAQTSDGIIIRVRCSFFTNGIVEDEVGGGQVLQKYTNKNEFDADAEFIRQLIYSNNGRLVSTRELAGIRSISYVYFSNNFKISPVVFMQIDNPEGNGGYGWIDIDVERG